MFVNLILRILLYFAGLTRLFVMCLKCPTDSARFRFLLLILAQLFFWKLASPTNAYCISFNKFGCNFS